MTIKLRQSLFALGMIVLLAGALRTLGLNWDQYSASHPDERFVTTITADMGKPDARLPEIQRECGAEQNFWNTACSAYNPHNLTDSRFAYGTLPLFVVNQTASMLHRITGDAHWETAPYIPLVGRVVHVLLEMLTVVVLFGLAATVLHDHRAAVLVAALYALAVLPIQLSHFYTVDIFSHFFFVVALYASAQIQQRPRLLWYLLAGIAVGAAAASRANLLIAIILIPVSGALYLAQQETFQVQDAGRYARGLVLAALGFLLLFRSGQPYAFDSQYFWDIWQWPSHFSPLEFFDWNPVWREELRAIASLSTHPAVDWPPSYQWFGRPAYLYPWWNWLWGMGMGLFLLGTVATFRIMWRQIHRLSLDPHLGLLSIWFGLYFMWQGQLHVMTLRYFLPLYGIWIIFTVGWLRRLHPRWRKSLRVLLFVGTALWAFAFTGIYRQPQTRIAATAWLQEYVPAALSLHTTADQFVSADVLRLYDQSLETSLVILGRDGRESLSLDFAPFELTTGQRLARLSLVFPAQNLPLSAHLSLLSGQDVLQRFSLETQGEGDFTLGATDLGVVLEAGRYAWRLEVSTQGMGEYFYVMPLAEWQNSDDYQSLPAMFSPVASASYWGKIPYDGITSQYPLTFRLQTPQHASAFSFAHLIGSTNTQLWLAVDGERIPLVWEESITSPTTQFLGIMAMYRLPQSRYLAAGRYEIFAEQPIWITGSTIATEGRWDSPVPSRICWNGRPVTSLGWVDYEDCHFISAFDARWVSDLALPMIEADTPRKILRMQAFLQVSDYLTIASNRMYDALPRYAERFPWVRGYYDGLFAGRMGFVQRQRFSVFPRFGMLTLPDQVLPDSAWPSWLNALEAEEAFTVYDHPTIYIFENRGFDPDQLPPYMVP